MNVRPDAVDDIFIIIVDQLPTSSLQARFINKLQKHESRAGVSEGRGSQMGVLHTNKRLEKIKMAIQIWLVVFVMNLMNNVKTTNNHPSVQASTHFTVPSDGVYIYIMSLTATSVLIVSHINKAMHQMSLKTSLCEIDVWRLNPLFLYRIYSPETTCGESITVRMLV